jgi:hypothetical protein
VRSSVVDGGADVADVADVVDVVGLWLHGFNRRHSARRSVIVDERCSCDPVCRL